MFRCFNDCDLGFQIFFNFYEAHKKGSRFLCLLRETQCERSIVSCSMHDQEDAGMMQSISAVGLVGCKTR